MKLRTVRNNKGFSLIELMVVVAIIMGLAAIGLPSMQKFAARAKRAEAQANLSGYYTAQKGFFAQYNTFLGCWETIGFAPEGRLNYRLQGAALAGVAPMATDATALTALGLVAPGACTTSTNGCTLAGGAGAITRCLELAPATASGVAAGATANQTFTARAGGQVYRGQEDQWSIDDMKQLNMTSDGIQ